MVIVEKVESFIHYKMFHSITYSYTCDLILRLTMTDAKLNIEVEIGHKISITEITISKII